MRPRSQAPGSSSSQDAWMTFPLFGLVLGAVVLASGVLLLTPLGRRRRTVVTVAIVLLAAGTLAGLEITKMLLDIVFTSDWLPDQS